MVRSRTPNGAVCPSMWPKFWNELNAISSCSKIKHKLYVSAIYARIRGVLGSKNLSVHYKSGVWKNKRQAETSENIILIERRLWNAEVITMTGAVSGSTAKTARSLPHLATKTWNTWNHRQASSPPSLTDAVGAFAKLFVVLWLDSVRTSYQNTFPVLSSFYSEPHCDIYTIPRLRELFRLSQTCGIFSSAPRRTKAWLISWSLQDREKHQNKFKIRTQD
jgi:hypothetical protein